MEILGLCFMCGAVGIILIVGFLVLRFVVFNPSLFVGMVVGGFAGLIAGLAVESLLHIPAISIAVGIVVCGIVGFYVANLWEG